MSIGFPVSPVVAGISMEVKRSELYLGLQLSEILKSVRLDITVG